jgi:hypothetical protein
MAIARNVGMWVVFGLVVVGRTVETVQANNMVGNGSFEESALSEGQMFININSGAELRSGWWYSGMYPFQKHPLGDGSGSGLIVPDGYQYAGIANDAGNAGRFILQFVESQVQAGGHYTLTVEVGRFGSGSPYLHDGYIVNLLAVSLESKGGICLTGATLL